MSGVFFVPIHRWPSHQAWLRPPEPVKQPLPWYWEGAERDQRHCTHCSRIDWPSGLGVVLRPSAEFVFTNFDGPGNNGGGTAVNAINNNGAVVGFSSDNAATPTLFTNFMRNPNGTFSSLNLNNDPLANANGINDTNVLVGSSNNNAFSSTPRRVLSRRCPRPSPATPARRRAYGINAAGTIVGQFTQNSTDSQPGFVLSHGVFTTFQATNTSTVTNVQNINNNGLAIGFSSADGVHQHGFTYDTTTQKIVLIADPVVPNLELTQFLGVNNNNMAVGYYQTNDGSQHGFLYNLNTHTYNFVDDPNAAKSGFSSPRSRESTTRTRSPVFTSMLRLASNVASWRPLYPSPPRSSSLSSAVWRCWCTDGAVHSAAGSRVVCLPYVMGHTRAFARVPT